MILTLMQLLLLLLLLPKVLVVEEASPREPGRRQERKGRQSLKESSTVPDFQKYFKKFMDKL